MKSKTILLVLISCLFVLAGCARPKGETPEQKREFVQQMATDTLAELYAGVPGARSLVEYSV